MSSELAERLGESKAAMAEVFRNPGLRKINVALAGSVMGDWAYGVAVSVYAYGQGGATAVGVYAVVRYVAMAVAGPFTAVLADRFDRKLVMVLADGVRFVLVAVAALVIAADGPAVAVYGLGLVTGLASTAFRPAQAALLPKLANHPGELTAANVASSTIESLGFFAGPAVAGLLLTLADTAVVFGFNAATFLWSGLLVASLRVPVAEGAVEAGEEDGEEDEAPTSIVHGAAAGFREILANRDLTVLMALYTAQTVIAGASLVFEVALVFELLGLSEAGVGLLDAMVGVGGLVGGFAALMLATRGRLASDFGIGVILWSAPLLLVVAVPELATVLVVMVLLGVGNSIVDINAFTIMQRLVPDQVMGRVFGAVDSVLIAGMALGSLAMPLLINTVGLETGLLVLGGSVTALAVVCLPALRRIDAVALAPEGLELLRSVDLFGPLPERSIERLARSATVVEVAAGGAVFERGDDGDRFYVIQSGEAEVVLHDGRRTRLGPGDAFGEIALLRDLPRQATVCAATDLTLRAIGRSVFLRVVTGHSETEASADRSISRLLVGD